MYEEKVVLCGANSYTEKYYLNPDFEQLPESIKNELKILCVLYVHDVGGILTLVFEENGELCFEVTSEEGDPMFDEIGSRLKIKQIQQKSRIFCSLCSCITRCSSWAKNWSRVKRSYQTYVVGNRRRQYQYHTRRFPGEEILGSFRMKSKQPRTSDEYGITLQELVERHGIPSSEIRHVIIASVVPDIMHSLGSAIIKYFHVKPIVVSAGIKTGIRIVTENPRQVGPDRIVDAVGAYTLHGGPVIVVDFGTATTYDIIGPDGTFEAGLIAPGLRTSAQALWGEADMLPAIEIRKPASILAKETISSMQGGLLYGQVGQTEYIIRRLKEESGYLDAKVVATGGLGKMIVAETDVVDVYDPQLTLKGLRIIFEKNRK